MSPLAARMPAASVAAAALSAAAASSSFWIFSVRAAKLFLIIGPPNFHSAPKMMSEARPP
jgi:hypothetical protein